jgi:N-formylglutamate deformylase
LITPFEILRPVAQTCPLVFASPHSGRAYSDAFLQQSVLDARTLRSSEDAFVDVLVGCIPDMGAPLLLAHAPRAYVDLNRAPDEFDPAVIDGMRTGGPSGAAQPANNPRIASGLGVIPRVVAGGRAIYNGKLPLAEAEARITQIWQPYHHALKQLLDETIIKFGQSILLDVHSMPSEAVSHHRSLSFADIILGDRHGASAGADITSAVEAAFVAEGLRVARNTPFSGAYIAQHYGRPFAQRHVVQIEISRGLYLNEAEITPLPQFDNMRALIARVMGRITEQFHQTLPLAAE